MKGESKVRVVSFERRSFKGTDGKDVDYRTAVLRLGADSSRAGGLIRVSVDTKLDLAEFVDGDALVRFELVPDLQLAPKVKVIEVLPA